MVWERNNIKKWRSSWTKTLVPSLEPPSIRRPLSRVFNYPRGEDLFTLNVLFSQCGSFFSTLDNVFFQISSCETTKFKRTSVEVKNTFNYVSIHNIECQSDIERVQQRHLLRSFQHLFTYAPHNRPSPVTTPKWPL